MMKALHVLVLLTVFFSACDSTTENAAPTVMQIAFSADFANGKGCTSAKDAEGCDLYMAEITSAGEVQSVTQLTDADTAESFPSWYPDGSIIYFNSQPKGSGEYEPPDIDYVRVDTGETGTLVKHASHPTVLPTGDAVIYSSLPKHILTQSSLADKGLAITGSAVLVEGEDRFEPTVSGDGSLVVFHEISEESPGVHIYNLQTGVITRLSSAVETGHCAINPAGDFVACDQKTGGGLATMQLVSDAKWEGSTEVSDPKISDIATLDQDYADCDVASVNFPSFLNDETLMVTISCHQREANGLSEALFSKLFLVQLETSTFLPLGKKLAESYGGSGKDSYTAETQ